MTTDPTVLVTGATGLQGGATARQLLAAGRQVRALVRDLDGPRAQALVRAGAEVVPGDMGDRASLDVAMRGVHGVFGVQPTAGYPGTPPGFAVEDEIRLGMNVIEAAHEADVRHLVYASVAGAERSSGIRRWESKWHIEGRIGALGVPATILRPVRFMENHLPERAAPYVATREDKVAVRYEATMLVAAIKCMAMTPSRVSLHMCSRCQDRRRRRNSFNSSC